MQRFLEFVGSHYILVSLFIGLVGLLLVTERRKAGEQLSPMRANQLVNHEDGLFLDVREDKLYRAGHIVSSKNISHFLITLLLVQYSLSASNISSQFANPVRIT